jgi:hypothetical protein
LVFHVQLLGLKHALGMTRERSFNLFLNDNIFRIGIAIT